MGFPPHQNSAGLDHSIPAEIMFGSSFWMVLSLHFGNREHMPCPNEQSQKRHLISFRHTKINCLTSHHWISRLNNSHSHHSKGTGCHCSFTPALIFKSLTNSSRMVPLSEISTEIQILNLSYNLWVPVGISMILSLLFSAQFRVGENNPCIQCYLSSDLGQQLQKVVFYRSILD